MASLRQSFLNGSLTRLVDPDTVLRTKIVEFVRKRDFGLASGQKTDGGYERVWFNETIASEEVSFEPGVFLLLKAKAKSMTDTPESRPDTEPPPGPEPEPDTVPGGGEDTELEPDTTPVPSKRTFRISGNVPPEVWNRLGTKVLPKLRGGSDIKIGIEFSVAVDTQLAQSFEAELKQVFEDLALSSQVRIE